MTDDEPSQARRRHATRPDSTPRAESPREIAPHPDTVLLAPVDHWPANAVETPFLRGEVDTFPAFTLPGGAWRGGEQADGRIQMPWVDMDAHGIRLLSFAHVNRPFQWSSDPRHERWEGILASLDAGEAADLDPTSTQELWDILWAVARADRFNEGTFIGHTVALTAIANLVRGRLLANRRRERAGITPPQIVLA